MAISPKNIDRESRSVPRPTLSRAPQSQPPAQAPQPQAPGLALPQLGNQLAGQTLADPGSSALHSVLAEQATFELAGVSPPVELGHNSAMLSRIMGAYSPGPGVVQDPNLQGGQPLPPAVLERMSRVFGRDFSHVRIHTDAASAQQASALNAYAFTIENHIWFGLGEFRPGQTEGDELLAHELTHVVQADDGRTSAAPAGVSRPTDTLEREAYQTQDRVVDALAQEQTLSPALGSEPLASHQQPASQGSTETTSATAGAPILRQEGSATSPNNGQTGQDGDVDIAAAVEQGLNSLSGAPPAPVPQANSTPAAPETPPATPSEAAPAQASSTLPTVSAPQPASGDGVAAVCMEPPAQTSPSGGGLQTGTLPAPQMQEGHSAFVGAVAGARSAIQAAIAAQRSAAEASAASSRAAVESASATMLSDVSQQFETTRQAIRAGAEATRANVRAELEARKAELAQAAQAQKQRVLDTSQRHQQSIQELYERLATAATSHGAAKAAELRTQADTQTSAIRNAAAQIANQYAGHDRANDIRISVQRMATEAANRVSTEITANAGQLAEDGIALAAKLRADGAELVTNIANGDADTVSLFDDALTEAQAALDESLNETLTQVDQAETQGLAQVDSLEGSVGTQLADLSAMHVAGVDALLTQALAGIDQAGERALSALDTQAQAVEDQIGGAHPSQWPGLNAELTRLAGEVSAQAQTVVGQLEGMGSAVASQITTAGEGCVGQMSEVGGNLGAQLTQISDGASSNFTQIETNYASGVGQQVSTYTQSWTTEADDKIRTLDESKAEAETSLNGTSTSGIAEIDKKFNDASAKLGEISSTTRQEMASKANEIANQSMFDRIVSAVVNFALGVFDAIVDFLKTILIIALIVLAVALIVAIVILVVWGAAALGAAVAAVAAFLVAAAEIIAIIGLILTVISIVFAVVSVIAAWNNPNLTTDERWRATGKGVGDIAMEFIPDFGISLLTKGDDLADAARAVENTGDLLSQADNVGDVANAADNVADVANGTDGLQDLSTAGRTLANNADEAQETVDAAQDAIRGANELSTATPSGGVPPVSAVDDIPTTAPMGNTPNVGAVDNATPNVGAVDNATPNTSAVDNAPPTRTNATTNSVENPQNLVDDISAQHILDGGINSQGLPAPGAGGHRYGTGTPGKTEFPQHWSDDDILHHVSDVISDPRAVPAANNPRNPFNVNGQPNRFTYYGVRDGVVVKVVYEPATGRVITAHPMPSNRIPPELNLRPDEIDALRNIQSNPPAPPATGGSGGTPPSGGGGSGGGSGGGGPPSTGPSTAPSTSPSTGSGPSGSPPSSSPGTAPEASVPTVQAPAGANSSPGGSTTPQTSTPQTSTPQTSTPQTSTPQTSTPQTSTPQTSTPQTSTPQTSTPQTSTPQTGSPQTSTPQTSTPQTSSPQTTTPQTTTPQTSTPQTSTPQTSTPQTSTPQTSTPQTSTPQTSTPQTSTPQTSTPQTSTPDTATSTPQTSSPDGPSSTPDTPSGAGSSQTSTPSTDGVSTSGTGSGTGTGSATQSTGTTPGNTGNVPDPAGPTDNSSFWGDLQEGYRGFDPNSAPEWLRNYQTAAEEAARLEGVHRPQLQAAYDLYKGFAMSTWQAVNGSGLVSDDGFAQNLSRVIEALQGWLNGNQENATRASEQQPQ